MKRIFFKPVFLLPAVVAMLPLFTSCSDDDDTPDRPEITINLTGTTEFETLVSEGTFDIPITITGIEKTPSVSDFGIMPRRASTGNAILDWDDASGDTEQPLQPVDGLKVAGIAAGEEDNAYILTIKYDVTGVMTAEYYDCHIIYGTAKSNKTFDFEYEGFAQESVGMPVATYSKSELTTSLTINIGECLDRLGITPDQYTGLQRSLYVGVREGDDVELLKSGDFSHRYSAFPSSGYSVAEGIVTPYVKILGVSKLPVGQIFEMHLIIHTDPGEYKAVNVPFMLTE